MSRSLKVAPPFIQQVKTAIKRAGFPSQKALATELGLSRPTVSNYLNGKPVDYLNFVEISEKLGLDWQQIALIDETPNTPPPPLHRTYRDWGDAPDVSFFCGRDLEKATLQQWIAQDNSRLVAVWGMGGTGKTALSVHLGREIASHFECVIWRSLRNAPPISDILTALIKFLSFPPQTSILDSLEAQILALIECFRFSSCLVILDNCESIREDSEGYSELFKRVGETPHRSCLFLTSREKPREFSALEGDSLSVRSYQLKGLPPAQGQAILKLKGLALSATDPETAEVIHRCAGNPLILKIVASLIQDVFDSNISEFLKHKTLAFEDIRALLDEQFNPLTDLEKQIMYWLAIEREPVSVQQLHDNLIPPVNQPKLLEALKLLTHRSLIEKNDGKFTLQPVVMEYVTDRFIEQISQEIKTGEIAVLNSHALIKATAKDYIRETQMRLILKLIADRLLEVFGDRPTIKQQCKRIISSWRQNPCCAGYAGGNILNVLIYLQIDLTGSDFSKLVISQAYLKNVNLHRLNFTGCHFKNTVFTENLSAIFSLAFTPDGKLLASGDYSAKLDLWQIETGQKVVSFSCPNYHLIRSVAFNAAGDILASAGVDENLYLWEVRTGESIKILTGHTDWINSVAFSLDGIIATGSNDLTVKLWNEISGECVQTLTGHQDYIFSVAFSKQGILASAGKDSLVILWDIKTGNCLNILQHKKAVYAVAFHPNGKILASAGADFTVKLWDIREVENPQLLATLNHSNIILTVAFSPDGFYLAGGGQDKTVTVWDVRNYNNCFAVTMLQGHTNWIRALVFSPDGKILASGGVDAAVKLWDMGEIEKSRCLMSWRGQRNEIRALTFSPDNSILASGGNDKLLRLWNLKEGRCLASLSSHTDTIFSVNFSPSGEIIATGSGDNTVKLWNAKTGKCVMTLRGHKNRVQSVAFSSKSQVIASGSRDYSIKLWDVKSGKCLMTLPDDGNRVNQVIFHPEIDILATGAFNGQVKIWDIYTGECLIVLQEHSRAINGLAFTLDGKILASGSSDGTVRLWDIKNSQCLGVLQGHKNWVNSVAFNFDGSILASGGSDKTARLWDVNSQQCIKTLRGHENQIYTTSYSLSDNILVTGSADETIKLWDTETGKCIKTISILKLYEGMNITRIRGLTETTIPTLLALGAVENER